LKTDTIIAIASALGIAVHLVVRFLVPGALLPAGAADWPLWVVLAAGGGPLLLTLARSLARGRFGADWLAGFSILTAALLGEYLVGAIVVLMLSGGAALEGYATRRASHVLEALARRVPQVAHRIVAGRVVDVSLADVRVGDELRLMPNEVCPVDGEVTVGRTTMDESYLTGEPFVTQKTPGSAVLSGAINGEHAIAIRATRRAQDSRYAHIMRVMQDAEQRRPALRRLADRLGAWYTPAALAVGVAAWMVSGQPGRFLAVMVIATPCPLLIAIPVAIIGAISLAARRGIIIRNPAALEEVGRCRTLVLDKTGTLTYGRPTLTEIVSVAPWRHPHCCRLWRASSSIRGTRWRARFCAERNKTRRRLLWSRKSASALAWD
jgi:cation transport ATPase